MAIYRDFTVEQEKVIASVGVGETSECIFYIDEGIYTIAMTDTVSPTCLKKASEVMVNTMFGEDLTELEIAAYTAKVFYKCSMLVLDFNLR